MTGKSRKSAYRDVVVAYREAATDNHLDSTVLNTISPASPLSATRLGARLDEAIQAVGWSSSPLRFDIIELPKNLLMQIAARLRG